MAVVAFGWNVRAWEPDDREIFRHVRAAQAAREAGDHEAEDRAWLRCIELDDGSDAALMGEPDLPPFRLRPYLSHADNLRTRGDGSAALTILERALVRWPDDAVVHMLVGVCHRSRRDWVPAAAALRRSAELDPRAWVCILLADSVDKLGRSDEAIAWLHRSLVVDPDYEESHYNLGCLDEKNGDIDAAIARFRRAIELDPDYAAAHARIGPLLLGRALRTPEGEHAVDWSLAFDHLTRATELRPDDGWSHGLASMCETAKRFNQAKRHHQAATRLLPEVAVLWAHLGNFLSLRGADREAERVLRHAVSLKPGDGWVRLWLGKYLWRVNRHDEGRTELLRSHDLGCSRALAALSALEADDGDARV